MMLALFAALSLSAHRRIRRPVPIIAESEENGIFSGFGCTVCQQLVANVEQALFVTPVPAEVKKIVFAKCDKMGTPLNAICHSLAETSIDTVISYLKQGYEKAQICKKINMCKAGASAFEEENGFSFDAVTCPLCEGIITSIEAAVVAQQTQQEIIQMASAHCDKIHKPYDALCNSFVMSLVPQMTEMLKEGIERAEVCQRVKLCKAAVANEEVKTRPAHKSMLYKKPRVTSKMHEHSMLYKKPEPHASLQTLNEKKLVCAICNEAIKIVEQALDSQKTIDAIETAALLLCNKVKQPMETLCITTVKEITPKLVHYISKKIGTLNLCVRIKACPKMARRFPARHLKPIL